MKSARQTPMHRPSATTLRDMLRYDPQTGEFFWNRDVHRGPKIGWRAGSIDSEGYLVIKIQGKRLKAHHIAWSIMTGRWPCCHLDHRDLNRSNNRWNNLRLATYTQNLANRRVRPDSKTKLKGVQWRPKQGYQARISFNGHRYHLGYFSTPQTASEAYQKAALQIFAEFARVS